MGKRQIPAAIFRFWREKKGHPFGWSITQWALSHLLASHPVYTKFIVFTLFVSVFSSHFWLADLLAATPFMDGSHLYFSVSKLIKFINDRKKTSSRSKPFFNKYNF